ncbi:MAG: sulfite exporter TauE/SafE family protein [Burkholderiaceae bacterium]
MIDLSWITLLSAALIVTFAYTVYGLTGFGATIVAVPWLAHFFPLRFAVPMMLVFDLFAGLLLGLKNRKHLDRKELLRLLPFLLLGMAAGVTLLVQASERWLLMLLGAFVLGYAAWSLLRKVSPAPISAVWAIPAGVIGGAFTALYGTGGPVYMIYLARRLPDKTVLRATIGVLIFGTALIRLALFTGSGFYTQRGLLPLALALLPCALIGYLAGSKLHAHLPTPRVIQAVWLLLIAGGASLLWRGLTMS